MVTLILVILIRQMDQCFSAPDTNFLLSISLYYFPYGGYLLTANILQPDRFLLLFGVID